MLGLAISLYWGNLVVLFIGKWEVCSVLGALVHWVGTQRDKYAKIVKSGLIFVILGILFTNPFTLCCYSLLSMNLIKRRHRNNCSHVR